MISFKEIWAFAAQKHDFPSKNLVIQLYGLATAGLLAWLEEKPTWAVGWLGVKTNNYSYQDRSGFMLPF